MKITRFVVASSVLLVCAGVASANLVTNGGFESYNTGLATSSGTYSGGNYYVFPGANLGINSWTISATSVDIVESGVGVDVNSGLAALDLVGTPGPGGVEQSLATMAGGTYSVSFWAKGTGGLNNIVNLSLGADVRTVNITGTWAQYTETFTGVVGSDLLKFYSDPANNGNGNTFIDDIEAVPEPATMTLLALGALAARRRKKA